MNTRDYRLKTQEELLQDRIIMVEGDLSEESMVLINCAMLRMDHESHEEITFYFRSDGGHANYGLVNYDVMRTLKSPTRAVVARAGSAASIMLMGCKKRSMLPSGIIMIHSPAPGNFNHVKYNEDFDKTIKHLKETGMNLAKRAREIYLARTKIKPKELDRRLKIGDILEKSIFAEEALSLGLVDDIIDVESEDVFLFP